MTLALALARTASDSGSVELRVEADPELIAIVDAVVHARKLSAPGTSRKEVVDEILRGSNYRPAPGKWQRNRCGIRLERDWKRMALAIEDTCCKGKRQFDSHKNAEEAASLSGRRREGQARSPYKCPVCKKWHIGTHQGTSGATTRRRRIEQIRKKDGERE